jgi:hypothetical protein
VSAGVGRETYENQKVAGEATCTRLVDANQKEGERRAPLRRLIRRPNGENEALETRNPARGGAGVPGERGSVQSGKMILP